MQVPFPAVQAESTVVLAFFCVLGTPTWAPGLEPTALLAERGDPHTQEHFVGACMEHMDADAELYGETDPQGFGDRVQLPSKDEVLKLWHHVRWELLTRR